MVKLASRSLESLPGLLLLAVLLAPLSVQAQDPTVQAKTMIKEAMDAYSNLDLDTSKAKLDEALGMSAQLDNATLGRIYVSRGILDIGGFSDNAAGQRNFMIALCLDSTIMVDPLLSTPEIDLMFNMSKGQINPAQCQQLTSGIVTGGGGGGGGGAITPPPGIPACGRHEAPVEQKQKWELPVYLELAPEMRGRAARIILKYAFDGGGTYKELPMNNVGMGFAAQIDCDQGQIRIFDPASIDYYIEGYDRMGAKVCGHGSAQAPITVPMIPDAAAVPGVQGLPAPQECAPCPPWDPECGMGKKPGLGEACQPNIGCAEDLVCGDSGLCEDEGGGGGEGPETFYVNVGGGVGFGYMKKRMEFDKAEGQELKHVVDEPSGFAFGGIPLRIGVGYYVIPNLAIEITGRLDLKFDSFTEPVSCWEGVGKDEDELATATCTGEYDDEESAKSSIALTDELDSGGQVVETKEMRWAALGNVRVRYQVVNNGAFRLSIFGGVGYGRIKYRVAAGDDPYFPMPQGVNVELGAGIAYFFTKNVGLVIDLPLDFIFIDGFAFNIDLAIGLGFGF